MKNQEFNDKLTTKAEKLKIKAKKARLPRRKYAPGWAPGNICGRQRCLHRRDAHSGHGASQPCLHEQCRTKPEGGSANTKCHQYRPMLVTCENPSNTHIGVHYANVSCDAWSRVETKRNRRSKVRMSDMSRMVDNVTKPGAKPTRIVGRHVNVETLSEAANYPTGVVDKDLSFCPGSTPKEMVNHPAHYGGVDNVYEVIKVLEAWGLDKSFCLGNAVKYIARAKQKTPTLPGIIEDLAKAEWYLHREISNLRKIHEKISGGTVDLQKRYPDFWQFAEESRGTK